MNRDQNLLALHQALRTEIAQADSQNYQVIGFAVAATAALVTAGVGQDSPLERAVVFSLVYLVTWPCQRLLSGKRRLVWRISSYLRVVVEPQLEGIGWEGHLAQLPKKGRSAGVLSTMAAYNEWLIITVLNAVAGLCLIMLGVLPSGLPAPNQALLATGVVIVNIGLSMAAKATERRLRRGHEDGPNVAYETIWSALTADGRASEVSGSASGEPSPQRNA